jgi:hypothetical protein
VVVRASYEDDGHIWCSLTRRFVGNQGCRHGWRRSSCKRAARPRELLRPTRRQRSHRGHFHPLAILAPNPPATWWDRFLTCTPKPLSRNISCISQSVAARHLPQLDVGPTQSRTFFVLHNITFDALDDSSRPCTQKTPRKPGYRSLFNTHQLNLLSLTLTQIKIPVFLCPFIMKSQPPGS